MSGVDEQDRGAGDLAGAAGELAGVVEDFDEAVGLGVVRSEAGGRSFPFHCTQIASGSRTIEVGTAVRFRVVAGRAGRWEAARVTSEGA